MYGDDEVGLCLVYNNIDNMKEDNKFDGRPYLGLPSSFK